MATAEANSLTSSETELPYNYYSLPFCKPPEGVKKSLNTINPGTILMGTQIENSPYNFSMLVSFLVLRQKARSAVLTAGLVLTPPPCSPGGGEDEAGVPAWRLLRPADRAGSGGTLLCILHAPSASILDACGVARRRLTGSHM